MLFNTFLLGGIDTSDATATASQIFNGQTAYVNGEKIVGTALATPTSATAIDIATGKTVYDNNGHLIVGTGPKVIVTSKSIATTNFIPTWNSGGSDYNGWTRYASMEVPAELQPQINFPRYIKFTKVRLYGYYWIYGSSPVTDQTYTQYLELAVTDGTPKKGISCNFGYATSNNYTKLGLSLYQYWSSQGDQLMYNASNPTTNGTKIEYFYDEYEFNI